MTQSTTQETPPARAPVEEAQRLLNQLRSSGTLEAVLDRERGSQMTMTPVAVPNTDPLRADVTGLVKGVRFAEGVEAPPSSTTDNAHAQISGPQKSILKTPIASPSRQNLATEELNRALQRQGDLEEQLDDTKRELSEVREELRAQRQESDLARRRLVGNIEQKARELEGVKQELDEAVGELKRQNAVFDSTRCQLEGAIKRQGEELDEKRRIIKKIRECVD